jgi:outer membrane murein-binding lipoprotein Lpp
MAAVTLSAVTLAAASLAGCASTPAIDQGWVGGDPAHLSADLAACHKEVANLDVNQISGYSDPRYGMTNAMAAAIAKDNPLTDTRPQIKAATFTTCMNDKGWRQP